MNDDHPQAYLKKTKTVDIGSIVKDLRENQKKKEEEKSAATAVDDNAMDFGDDIDFSDMNFEEPINTEKQKEKEKKEEEEEEEEEEMPPLVDNDTVAENKKNEDEDEEEKEEKEKQKEKTTVSEEEKKQIEDDLMTDIQPDKQPKKTEEPDSDSIPEPVIAPVVEEEKEEAAAPAPAPATTSAPALAPAPAGANKITLPANVTLESEKAVTLYVQSHLVEAPVIPPEKQQTLKYLNQNLYINGTRTWANHGIERSASRVTLAGHSLKGYEVAFQGLPLKKRKGVAEPQDTIKITNVCWLKGAGMSPKKSESFVACAYVKTGTGYNDVMFGRLSIEQQRSLFSFFTDVDTAVTCNNISTFRSANYDDEMPIPVIPHFLFVEKCSNRMRSGGKVDAAVAKDKEAKKEAKQVETDKKAPVIRLEPLLKVPSVFRENSKTGKMEKMDAHQIARNINITMRTSRNDIDFENDGCIDKIAVDEIGFLSQPVGIDNDIYQRRLAEIDAFVVDDDKRLKELLLLRDKDQKTLDKIDGNKSADAYIKLVERLTSTKERIKKMNNNNARIMKKLGGRRIDDIDNIIDKAENSSIIASFSGGRDSWGKYCYANIANEPIKFVDFQKSLNNIKNINNMKVSGGVAATTEKKPHVDQIEQAIDKLVEAYNIEDNERLQSLKYDWEAVVEEAPAPAPAPLSSSAKPLKSILKQKSSAPVPVPIPVAATTTTKTTKAKATTTKAVTKTPAPVSAPVVAKKATVEKKKPVVSDPMEENDDEKAKEKEDDDNDDDDEDEDAQIDKIKPVVDERIGLIRDENDILITQQQTIVDCRVSIEAIEQQEDDVRKQMEENMKKLERFEASYKDCQRRNQKIIETKERLARDKSQLQLQTRQAQEEIKNIAEAQKRQFGNMKTQVKKVDPTSVSALITKKKKDHEDKKTEFSKNPREASGALVSPINQTNATIKPKPEVLKYLRGEIHGFIDMIYDKHGGKEKAELDRLIRLRNEREWMKGGLDVSRLKRRDYKPTPTEILKRDSLALIPSFSNVNKTNALKLFLESPVSSTLNYVANYVHLYDPDLVEIAPTRRGSHANYYDLFRDFMSSDMNLNRSYETKDMLEWAKKSNIEGSEKFAQRLEDLKLRLAYLVVLFKYLNECKVRELEARRKSREKKKEAESAPVSSKKATKKNVAKEDKEEDEQEEDEQEEEEEEEEEEDEQEQEEEEEPREPEDEEDEPEEEEPQEPLPKKKKASAIATSKKTEEEDQPPKKKAKKETAAAMAKKGDDDNDDFF